MKVYILLALLSVTVYGQLLGQCGMAPKYRPISCYEGKVLPEDLPELKDLLEQFRNGGDDHEFANFLGDMFDKKDFREGRESNEEENSKKLLGKCGMHPKYLPYECYEPNVLRRDRTKLKQTYDELHGSDLEAFNEVLVDLRNRKFAYFEPKEE